MRRPQNLRLGEQLHKIIKDNSSADNKLKVSKFMYAIDLLIKLYPESKFKNDFDGLKQKCNDSKCSLDAKKVLIEEFFKKHKENILATVMQIDTVKTTFHGMQNLVENATSSSQGGPAEKTRNAAISKLVKNYSGDKQLASFKDLSLNIPVFNDYGTEFQTVNLKVPKGMVLNINALKDRILNEAKEKIGNAVEDGEYRYLSEEEQKQMSKDIGDYYRIKEEMVQDIANKFVEEQRKLSKSFLPSTQRTLTARTAHTTGPSPAPPHATTHQPPSRH